MTYEESPDAVWYGFSEVEVPNPTRWWTATRKQLVEQRDPDVDDGIQRYPDRDDIRWHLIAALLSQVTAKLDAGDYRWSTLHEDSALVDVTGHPDGYTAGETIIILSWFDYGEFPRADAWEWSSGNGRHRLYNCWLHRPDAHLPVRSHLLDFLDDLDSERLVAAVREKAMTGLAQLPAVVRERSPHYVRELEFATQAVMTPQTDRSPA